MISAHDTAYPRFKGEYTDAEVARIYTPTEEDRVFCTRVTKGRGRTKLGFIVLLKSFQRLGFFVRSTDVPPKIVNHIATAIQTETFVADLQKYDSSRVRKTHMRMIRQELDVMSYSEGGSEVLLKAMQEAARTKEDLGDIINAGLETLVRFRFELPAFGSLVRDAMARRKAAYHQIFQKIHGGLGNSGRDFLDQLLVTDPLTRVSPWNNMKQDTPRPSLKTVYRLLGRFAQVTELAQFSHLLGSIPFVKIKQMALEANSLDAAGVGEVEPLKRYALTLAQIHTQRAKFIDDLCDVFVKQMNRVKNKAKVDLERYIEQNQAKTDEIIKRFALLDDILRSSEDDVKKLDAVSRLIKSRPDLTEFSKAHADHGGKQPVRFMWRYFKGRRSALMRILDTLTFVSTTHDKAIMESLGFMLMHKRARADWVDLPEIGSLDLSWIPDPWWKLVTNMARRDRRPAQINRRHFEVCLCIQLVQELKSGDICVVGSDVYSDHRAEFLPINECRERLPEYGERVGLPTNQQEFINHIKRLLANAASEADQGYEENDYLEIVDGEPRLKRYRKKTMPAKLDEIEGALSRRLLKLDLSVLDVITETMKWLDWGRFFGPLSGHRRKISEERRRYIMTVFSYGCGLGPTQAARTIDEMTARQIAFLNKRHISADKLDDAIREVINAYNHFELPKYWGDGKHAAADGTKWNLYENNLLSEYHIRYGGYGGIAYYHVSDTYIALFSHFIPCGVWEAVYILDGLMKNKSDIQPDTLHGDTQSQNLPVFALAFLLGIKLLPRIRNWKDLKLYKASPESRYEHINALFTVDNIDHDLIARHVPDMFQVAQSIQAGVISPSTILRRLGTASRKNRLYYAFRELGRVVRTISLLSYLSDIELQRTVTSVTNKCESFNKFAKWAHFASDTIQQNVRDEQVKIIKYNHLVANLLIFHNVHSMTRSLRDMAKEGIEIDPEILALFNPYRTRHLNRFGRYDVRDRDVDEVNYELELMPLPVSTGTRDLPN